MLQGPPGEKGDTGASGPPGQMVRQQFPPGKEKDKNILDQQKGERLLGDVPDALVLFVYFPTVA